MRTRPHRARFRPGLALRRDPRLWWVATATSALALGWLVSSVLAGADQVRRAWGASEVVLVARHRLEPGEPVGAGDVELVERPVAVVPDGALHELPAGQRASALVESGEVVIRSRLAPAGLTGLAASLPPGSRAVAVPVEPGTAPPLVVGDRVDVVVALAAEAAGAGPPGFVIAAGAQVVAVDDTAVTVAVSPPAAPRIAVALGQGAVTLALVGG